MKRILTQLRFGILYFFVCMGLTFGFDWLIYHVDLLILARLFKLYLAITLGLFLGIIRKKLDKE